MAIGLLGCSLQGQVQLKKELSLMHSPSSIIVVGKDSIEAQKGLNKVIEEFEWVESKISEWKPDSEVSEINRQAGIKAVEVSPWVFDFIERSIKISQLTDGAFDLSWASLRNLWTFEDQQKSIPNPDSIKASVRYIDYNKILLDKENHSVFLAEKGMKIGTGGNGQGLGVDRAIAALKEMGIPAAMVNASGDIYAYGSQADGEDWQIGISNPLDKKKVFAFLSLNEKALTTAGDYEKYIWYKGKKYSHIIDPRTGYPAQGVQSVSVYSPSAELSDALDTAFFILGKEVAMNIANQIAEVECIIVDQNNEIFYSNGIQKHIQEKF